MVRLSNPNQSTEELGREVLGFVIVWGVVLVRFARRSVPRGFPFLNRAARMVLPLFGMVPYLIGAIVLLSGDEAGLGWIFAGIVGSVIAAVMDAWILLVEIRR